VGTLVPPRALAVTVTGPVAPAVQIVKVWSQCPAQATPVGDIFRIEVSFELKVIGVLRLVPDAVWTAAVKTRVPPRVSEAVDGGLRVILPGNNGGPGCDPPPQPRMGDKNRMATAKRKPSGSNLPMHSSFFIAVLHHVDSQPAICLSSA
jgi:hypothetical protein